MTPSIAVEGAERPRVPRGQATRRRARPRRPVRGPRAASSAVSTGQPALAVSHRLGVGKPSVCLARVVRLLLDARAVAERSLFDGVGPPVVSSLQAPVG